MFLKLEMTPLTPFVPAALYGTQFHFSTSSRIHQHPIHQPILSCAENQGIIENLSNQVDHDFLFLVVSLPFIHSQRSDLQHMYMFLLAGKNIPGVEYLQGEFLFVKQMFSDYQYRCGYRIHQEESVVQMYRGCSV